MLVVVEHGNVHQFAQALLDDEAFRRLDVLQIDAAERRREIAHAVDEFVDILGRHFQIDGVDVGEFLKQNGLTLHHWLAGQGADIAEPEHGSAVGDDGDEVTPRGVVVGGVGIVVDFHARRRHAGRIGHRQIALGDQGLRRRDGNLAGLAGLVHMQRVDIELAQLPFLRHVAYLPPRVNYRHQA